MNSPGNLLTTTLTFYDAAGQVQYSVDARGTVTQNPLLSKLAKLDGVKV